MRRFCFCLIGFLAVSFGTISAQASIIVLDFEGLKNIEAINGFYNGGTGSLGSMGTNYGVEFSDNALAIIDSDAGGTGNFGGEPSPDTVMFFLDGNPIMNVAAGFDTGFSFYYSAVNNPGSLEIFDGEWGTGNVLATLFIPTTPSDGGDPTGTFSPFFQLGVEFSGIARSVLFGGVQNQIGFDNVTFGSSTPGGVIPEPGSFMVWGVLALAGVGFTNRRRKS